MANRQYPVPFASSPGSGGGGTPGGSNGDIQFNNNGAFGGAVDLLTGSTECLPVLKSLKIVANLRLTGANGDNTLYTVPASTRATLAVLLVNPTAGSISYSLKTTIGATTYTITQPVAVVANTSTIAVTPFNTWPIAEAGDVFVMNFTAAGLLVMGYVVTFASTEGLKSPRSGALVSGANTIYTCPVGKRAFLLNVANANSAPLRIYNNSGSTRTFRWHSVPSGGSPSDSTNLLTPTGVTVANNAASNQINATIALEAGDFLDLTLDANAANSLAAVLNLLEVTA